MLRRRNYRRRFNRRRKFRTTRVQKSRRLFRKFIRRKALKPELKYQTTDSQSPSIPPNGCYTAKVTPSQINFGTSAGTRIGQRVNFIKLDITAQVRNDSTTSVTSAPTMQSAPHRFVVWSPRTDITTAVTYMNAIGVGTIIDYSYVTVYRDVIFHLSPPYMAESTSNDIAGGPCLYLWLRRFSLRFPRKVTFGGGNTLVDEEKYSCYFTVVTSGFPAVANLSHRTYYYDA